MKNAPELPLTFDRREVERRQSHALAVATAYIHATLLDPTKGDNDFIETAERYADQWIGLPADQVSMIAWDLEKRGALGLSGRLADRWAAAWLEKPSAWSSLFYSPESFHPTVRRALLEGNERFQQKPELLKSVLQVMSGGWYPTDQTTINEATTDEIDSMLHSLNGDTFPTVVHFYTRELTQPLTAQGGE